MVLAIPIHQTGQKSHKKQQNTSDSAFHTRMTKVNNCMGGLVEVDKAALLVWSGEA